MKRVSRSLLLFCLVLFAFPSFAQDDGGLSKIIEIIQRLEKANEIAINFAPNSAILSPAALAAVKKQSAIILQLPANTVIDIESHRYGGPDESANIELTRKRAETVKAALVRFGVKPLQLTANGLGSAFPLFQEDQPPLKTDRINYVITMLAETADYPMQYVPARTAPTAGKSEMTEAVQPPPRPAKTTSAKASPSPVAVKDPSVSRTAGGGGSAKVIVGARRSVIEAELGKPDRLDGYGSGTIVATYSSKGIAVRYSSLDDVATDISFTGDSKVASSKAAEPSNTRPAVSQSSADASQYKTVAEKFFERAASFLKAPEDFTSALGAYTQAILLDPTNGKYFYNRGKVYYWAAGHDYSNGTSWNGGHYYALRDMALARKYGYSEEEVARFEKSIWDELHETPTDLNSAIRANLPLMEKFAYSKMPAIGEHVPFCSSVADCVARGEKALQIGDISDRLQAIYLADEALRISPNSGDAAMLRARGFATLGLAEFDDPLLAGVSFCDAAIRDARLAAKDPNASFAAATDLWTAIEDSPAMRRTPKFYCTEFAKANPARREIDASRENRRAEIQRDWEAEVAQIKEQNRRDKGIISGTSSSGSNAVADFDRLVAELKLLDREYKVIYDKIARQIEKDAKSGIRANLFMNSERQSANAKLDQSRRLITDFLKKYDKVIDDASRARLQEWHDDLPTYIPI